MGEKPLGIDEAPARMGTIMGGAPLGGGEIDPMAGAAGIITTRSNIKHSASAAATSQLPKGLEPTPTRPGDPFPDKPGPPGIAIKENGIKVDGGAAGAEGVGQTAEPVAMEGDPVPGLDVKLGKNPGGAASAAAPGAEVDDTPDGDELDPMAGAAGINTTRSNIKNAGSVTDGGSGSGEVGVEATPAPPPGQSGAELDPMAMKTDLINTTRSNIKNSGSVADGGSGSGAAPDQGTPAPPPGQSGDELDPMAGATAINTTRSNLKNVGGVAETGSGSGEVGVDATPAGGAPGVAEGVGKPIPGVDIVIKKNPPR